MARRILGMEDVFLFFEKAQEVMRQEDVEELQKTIMSVKFDFNDFLKQTRAVFAIIVASRNQNLHAKVVPFVDALFCPDYLFRFSV